MPSGNTPQRQKRASDPQVPEFIGGRTRTRTLDPLIKSQLLYQLSYAPGLPAFVLIAGAVP